MGVHSVYYDTCALLLITKLQMYNKEEYEFVKSIVYYQPTKESNTFVF